VPTCDILEDIHDIQGGLIEDNKMIMKESFGLCPYMASMQREQKRNAAIRDEKRRQNEDATTDIPEAELLMARLNAHIKKRIKSQTKTRWISLAKEYAKDLVISEPMEKDAMRRYLQEAIEKKEKSKRWVRVAHAE